MFISKAVWGVRESPMIRTVSLGDDGRNSSLVYRSCTAAGKVAKSVLIEKAKTSLSTDALTTTPTTFDLDQEQSGSNACRHEMVEVNIKSNHFHNAL